MASRCEGCGGYFEPDPITPDGRGHQVPNADGSPGFCGPISDEPAPTYTLTRAEVEAIARQAFEVGADLAGGSGEHAALAGEDEYIARILAALDAKGAK